MQAAAELAWQKEKADLQSARAAAQRRLQDVEKVNAELQGYLDTTAQATAGQTPKQGIGYLEVIQLSHTSVPLQI